MSAGCLAALAASFSAHARDLSGVEMSVPAVSPSGRASVESAQPAGKRRGVFGAKQRAIEAVDVARIRDDLRRLHADGVYGMGGRVRELSGR